MVKLMVKVDLNKLSDEDAQKQQWLETADTAARAVPDPELPFLTVGDLGILRGIEYRDGKLCIKVSPTYTGCPAVAVIEQSIASAVTDALLKEDQTAASTSDAGALPEVIVERTFSPAWTTRDLTADGRRKLLANGIAPPQDQATESEKIKQTHVAVDESPVTFLQPTANASSSLDNTSDFFSTTEVACPRCQSSNTAKLSAFGSTPCKAQYRCNSCLEPFDYFKCLGHD